MCLLTTTFAPRLAKLDCSSAAQPLHRLIKRRRCLTSLWRTSEKQEFRQQIKRALNGIIETLKAIEPETGCGAILKLSEAEEPCGRV
jgi:hypothetical protein